MERDQDRYRRVLIELIAAAYRPLDTWEEGNPAGRVTTLSEVAHYWDTALGLGVAERRSERSIDDEMGDDDEENVRDE